MTRVKQEPDAVAVQKGRLDALELIAKRKNQVPNGTRTNARVEADTILVLLVNSLIYQQEQIHLRDRVIEDLDKRLQKMEKQWEAAGAALMQKINKRERDKS